MRPRTVNGVARLSWTTRASRRSEMLSTPRDMVMECSPLRVNVRLRDVFAYGSLAHAPAPQPTQYVASGIASSRPYAIGL